MACNRLTERVPVRGCVALALTALCAGALAAQTPAPAPTPSPRVEQTLPPLAPGALPAEATAEARAAWETLCSALGVAPDTPRVEAFELSFDARAWQAGGESEKSFRNGQLRFLAPGFVDSALETGRRRLRGPRGDWLVDAKGGAVRLQGVELAQDRRELDQIVHIARTFANLVNARSLRLRRLETLPAPPFALPAAARERANGALWLALVSPDFGLARADGAARNEAHVWLALEQSTHLPLLAVVADGGPSDTAAAAAVLVELWNWAPLDGLRAPKNVRTYPPRGEGAAWAFEERQNLQLWLTKGTLRAKLAPQDFEPPAK